MKTVVRTCLTCQDVFNASTKEVNRGNGKYCSKACFSKRKITTVNPKPNVSCASCLKPFYRVPSKLKNSKHGLHFCSRLCKDTAQRIGGISEMHPPHYGSGTTKVFYRRLAFSEFLPECNRCGYKEHPTILQVHHKDRNRLNNIVFNLELLCPNCHAKEHWLK